MKRRSLMGPTLKDSYEIVNMLRKDMNNPRKIFLFIKGVYMQGYIDGQGNLDGKIKHLPLTNKIYETECPYCHERMNLDLDALAKTAGEE